MSSPDSISGAAAAQLGFDYQIDVSILAALQLLLVANATERLVLEPANEEDLEADLVPHVPGRIQSSATIAHGYKLVVQVKRREGEPWSLADFTQLLKHGSDKPRGRRPASNHLDDPYTRYLLVTTANVKGKARGLLVDGFEDAADRDKFPVGLKSTLKQSPEGRVAIWGGLTERQLALNLRELMSDLLHIPRVKQEPLLDQLRTEAKRRTRGSTPGIWTREDLLATVRTHGGFLSSHTSLDDFVPPANFEAINAKLTSLGAVVIRGPSGTGKTQVAHRLCELARQRDGRLEVVSLGANDTPTNARKLVNHGPTLFYIEDPWGQNSLCEGADGWTAQLPLMLSKASPDHQFVITSRSDMMSGAQRVLSQWSIELDAEQYRGGQLRQLYDIRMEQLPSALQSMAYEFRHSALEVLETPLEVELYLSHLARGAEPGEADHTFSRRLLELAHRDAVEGVVISALGASDTSGGAAIIWALLAARGQFDRSQLSPLQRVLSPLNRGLGEGLEKLVNRMVAARHLRQPGRTVTFSHPSVRQGFESFLLSCWMRSEGAILNLISALIRLPGENRAWGLETAARVFEVTRKFVARGDEWCAFEIEDASQTAIDCWLDEALIDPASDLEPLLTLASEVGSDASIPSRVARWLIKGTQRGLSLFNDNWTRPEFDDDWYETVSADPRSRVIAERFIREMLGFDQGLYGISLVERLDRIALNLTQAYLDAAIQTIGNGFETNADVVAAGAVRDLIGYEAIVTAALNELAEIQRGYGESYAEEWRAIEDGERDSAIEEAMQWRDEGVGFTSTVFVETYVRSLRSKGSWQVLSSHTRMSELLSFWIRDVRASEEDASFEEIDAIITHSREHKAEHEAWKALGQYWQPQFEQMLAERLSDCVIAGSLRLALAEVALVHAPALMVKEIKNSAAKPGQQLLLLVEIGRVGYRLGVENRVEVLRPVTDHLAPEFAEIIAAITEGSNAQVTVGSAALKILIDGALNQDAETLSFVVPLIVASGGCAIQIIAYWLTIAQNTEDAGAASEMAILVGDTELVEQALRHRRSQARLVALGHLTSAYPGVLPKTLLVLASDPSSQVRRALLSTISERPCPEHLKVLLNLMYDKWSSADHHQHEADTFSIAQKAVAAMWDYSSLEDCIGDMLIELAKSTSDRTLSQLALTVSANLCGPRVQQQIWHLVNLEKEHWIRLDALEALINAETIDPSLFVLFHPDLLLNLPAILAAPAAELIGTHVSFQLALALFKSVSSENRRRVLLLVGANAMIQRNRSVADQILDLLEPGHPARQLFDSCEPLPLSVIDDLGAVEQRQYARLRLKGRIAEC